MIREYIWLDGVPIAVVEGGVIYYVRTDHIGRPVFATNAAGVKVWTASYLPFGGVRTSTGSAITLRFPGQWFQSESGLHQNWMRDYDPTTGRYLQADPLGLVDGASAYGYARQSPAMVTDPTGQCPWCVAGVVYGLSMLYDYMGDEDCYTLGDFAYSATLNNPYNPFKWVKWVKRVGKGYGASNSGESAGNLSGSSQSSGGGSNEPPIHVTSDGVALPNDGKHNIPENYVENPYRKASYGEYVNGKFVERLRIDPATATGNPGPEYSHYHLDGGPDHFSPKPGGTDPGF